MAKWQVKESEYPVDFKFLYVSKDGNNANAGTQAAPLLEINAAILKAQADANYLIGKVVIVIGSGLWAETLSTTRTKQYRFIGDGEVIFNGGGEVYIFFQALEYVYNVKMINYDGKRLHSTTNSEYPLHLTNCDIDWVCFINLTANQIICVSFNKCVFSLKLTAASHSQPKTLLLYSENSIIKDCITSASPSIAIPRIVVKKIINSVLYDSGNIMGELIIDGEFNYNNLVNGTFKSTLQELKTAGSNQQSLSAPPKFTNETIGDYTYQPDSPCLRRGKDGANIGVYGRGYAYPPNAAEWLKANGATFSQSYVGGVLEDDIELNIDSFWSFKTGHKTGWVKSAIIDLGSDVKLSRANLKATMGFDAFTGKLNKTVDFECQDFGTYVNTKKYYRGDTCNVSGTKYKCILDYPDETPFVEYPPASSPTYWGVMSTVVETSFQIDFEMRYGFTLTEINAASYKKILYNNPVKVDTSGYGNADDNFNIELAETITTRFIQLIVKLKDLT